MSTKETTLTTLDRPWPVDGRLLVILLHHYPDASLLAGRYAYQCKGTADPDREDGYPCGIVVTHTRLSYAEEAAYTHAIEEHHDPNPFVCMASQFREREA